MLAPIVVRPLRVLAADSGEFVYLAILLNLRALDPAR